MAPAQDGKTQKCCNLQHFVTFENRKIVRKMCQNGSLIFPILGTLKIGEGIMLLETLMSDPDSVQKAFPPPSWKIFGVFRGPASEGRRLGVRLTIEL